MPQGRNKKQGGCGPRNSQGSGQGGGRGRNAGNPFCQNKGQGQRQGGGRGQQENQPEDTDKNDSGLRK